MSAKKVYRFTFRNGSSEVRDAFEVEQTLARQRAALKQVLEVERAVRSQDKYERHRTAQRSAHQRRQKRNLDTRDEHVRIVAAEEKQKGAYGYIKRAAKKVKLPFHTVKQILGRKKTSY